MQGSPEDAQKHSNNNARLLGCVVDIARRAGQAILEVYATDFGVRTKGDASPVTEADEKAEDIIRAELTALDSGVPIVSEEASDGNDTDIGGRFWLVDPLDGTKEFIGRNGEFTVNIALIEEGRPVLGVVFAPAIGRLYAGADGVGAFVEHDNTRVPIHCRDVPTAGLTVVASRSHGDANALDAYLAGRKVEALRSAGSSLKLCLVASGEADLYPRLGRTMEWDIAAGHAIVRNAGGSVQSLDGHELVYGKPGFENPQFVAGGAPARSA